MSYIILFRAGHKKMIDLSKAVCLTAWDKSLFGSHTKP